MKHIVMFSGGAASFCAALRVIESTKDDQIVLLFADTRMEDEDLYRFLNDVESKICSGRVSLVRLDQGEDVWQCFFRRRFLGNSRIDTCSETLKRKPMRKWLESNCTPADTIVYLGMDWTEGHRVTKAAKFWVPWNVLNPLSEPPYLSKAEMLQVIKDNGIEPPRLYSYGFAHNNCGGFCVKAGQAQFKLLLKTMPCRYGYHEQKEQEIREYLGKPVAILRDYRKEGHPPMTLAELRIREDFDKDDWGGCGCLVPVDEDA